MGGDAPHSFNPRNVREGLPEELPSDGQCRGGFPRARRAVEQQVRELPAGKQA